MDPEEFLKLADELKNSKDKNEAKLRTSVSRSYYALFNLMKDCLKSLDFKIPDQAAGHTKTKNCFLNCEIDHLEKIAGRLGYLREERNKADYDLNESFEENSATFRYLQAKKDFKTFLNSINSSKKRNQIKKKITNYLEKSNQSDLL